MNLYKVSQSTGKMQVWSAFPHEGEVITKHGELGGKIQESRYTAEPKNVGRSNETTSAAQAIIEVDALYVAQQDNKHYRPTVELANKLADDCKIPRKIHNYKDHGHKMPEVMYSSIKKNGSRACVIDGKLYSKIGKLEEVKVQHIREAIEKLGEHANFDAEVYCHGLSLQRIRAAWTKPVRTEKEIAKKVKEAGYDYCPNEDARSLELHVFDIPLEGETFESRMKAMGEFETRVSELGLEDTIKVIWPQKLDNTEDRELYRDTSVGLGYEGLVHYDPEDLYEFGKRTYTTQKDKPRYDAEAYVTGVEKCKNGDGKLILEAADVLDNVKFKCMMKVSRRDGNDYPRDVDSMSNLIGEWITFSYEELSDKGVPTKPVGEEVRECNSKGEPQQ